jgi:hypothetical protein
MRLLKLNSLPGGISATSWCLSHIII